MRCQKVRSYLSSFSEGDLASDKAVELEVHIKSCKRCDQEKVFLEQMVASARTLPVKKLADDFNLKLFNHIYAEQNHPTESYLPTEKVSWYSRPLGWATVAATVAVCAFLTVVWHNRGGNTLDAGRTSAAVTEERLQPTVQYASMTGRAPARAYEDVIGVRGTASRYRATSLDNSRVLRLSEAQVESLYANLRQKLGEDLRETRYATGQIGQYGVYGYPVRATNTANGNPGLIRNASVRR